LTDNRDILSRHPMMVYENQVSLGGAHRGIYKIYILGNNINLVFNIPRCKRIPSLRDKHVGLC